MGPATSSRPQFIQDREGNWYALLAKLGSGGFGDVYLAYPYTARGYPNRLAIKLLRPDLKPGADGVNRLHDEREILRLLDHAAILQTYGLLEFPNEQCLGLATEYIPGTDLDECLQQGLPRQALLETARDVADALWAAHQAKVLHRDVTPRNIRINYLGKVKLLDFGIARAKGKQHRAQTTGGVVATLSYTAPERLTNPRNLTSACDVFSLGCVLYRGWTGRTLWHGKGEEIPGVLASEDRFRTAYVEALTRVSNSRFRGLLSEMLAYNPAERPSAAEIAAECTELLQDPNWLAPEHRTSLGSYCRSFRWSELVRDPPTPPREVPADVVRNSRLRQEETSTAPPALPLRGLGMTALGAATSGALILTGLLMANSTLPAHATLRGPYEVQSGLSHTWQVLSQPHPIDQWVTIRAHEQAIAACEIQAGKQGICEFAHVFDKLGSGTFEVRVQRDQWWTRPLVDTFEITVVSPYCGNGVLNEGEECDFGAAANTGNPGECTAECTLPWTEVPEGRHRVRGPEMLTEDEEEESNPFRTVTLAMGFEMLSTEVTMAQFHNDPEQGLAPMALVTWDEASQWCEDRGGALPTELEWEVAARAYAETPWGCGDEPCLLRHAWYAENSDTLVHAVATLNPNIFGLFDMHGNVQEWVQDCDGGWPAVEQANHYIAARYCRKRVLRGGAANHAAHDLSAHVRNGTSPVEKRWNIGFRCVRGSQRRPIPGGVQLPR